MNRTTPSHCATMVSTILYQVLLVLIYEKLHDCVNVRWAYMIIIYMVRHGFKVNIIHFIINSYSIFIEVVILYRHPFSVFPQSDFFIIFFEIYTNIEKLKSLLGWKSNLRNYLLLIEIFFVLDSPIIEKGCYIV